MSREKEEGWEKRTRKQKNKKQQSVALDSSYPEANLAHFFCARIKTLTPCLVKALANKIIFKKPPFFASLRPEKVKIPAALGFRVAWAAPRP